MCTYILNMHHSGDGNAIVYVCICIYNPTVPFSWIHSKTYQPDAVTTRNKARFGLDLSEFSLFSGHSCIPDFLKKKGGGILKKTKPLEYLLKLLRTP